MPLLLKQLLLMGTSAVLYVLAFPDAAQFYLAWVALVPLLYVVLQCTPRRAFLLGWLAGALYAIGISYWVYGAITNFTETHPAVALLFQIFVVGGWMGLYYGLFSLAAAWLRSKNFSDLLTSFAAASLWVCFEYLRGNFLLAMPWAQLGHSQAGWLPMAQMAELFGVYGLSFLIALCNTSLALLAIGDGALKQQWRLQAGLAAGALLLPAVYGLVRLPTLTDGEKTIRVGIVQPAIEQNRRWKKEQYALQLEQGLLLSQLAVADGAKLLAWPENAFQFYLQDEFPDRLRDFLNRNGVEILAGAPRYEGRPYHFFNSAMLLADGRIKQYYDKMELLPFGEYFPLRGIDFLTQRYAGPREYEPGTKTTPMASQGVMIGNLICFEIIFPSVLAKHVAAGAQIFANLSNEAWFSRGSMAEQHLQMAQTSAISFRRPIVRSANTGISALVDASGEVSHRIELFEKGARVVEVAPRLLRTLYSHIGDTVVLACLLFLSWLLWQRDA